MRALLIVVGFCVVLLVLATSSGVSGEFCVGQNHGCLLVNSDGVHLVSNTAAARLRTTTP